MRTEPAPGSDPAPAGETPLAEEEPRAWGDGSDANDDRLKADKPPHWG